jgi:histidinol dehydrogenase
MIQLTKEEGLRHNFQRNAEIPARIFEQTEEILSAIKSKGDEALQYYASKFDGIDDFSVDLSQTFIIDENLAQAIDLAISNISTFHASQVQKESKITTTPGVTCWRKSLPIQHIGLYVPGGSAPLFSTLLMLAIPAQIAGCKEITVCTPPDKNGGIHPVIGYILNKLGLQNVLLLGGAQAIGALAYGTESIRRVDKIFGPGNAYVTAAKMLIQKDGIAIDLPAGPSEVAIVADETADPAFIAADLLSQAEHGPDSVVYFLTNSDSLVEKVSIQLDQQVQKLPREEIARKSLEKSYIITGSSTEELMDVSNYIAPEHLIINAKDAHALADLVIHAGSVFIGPYSSESIGDYASGTNHTLPTNGFARAYSGVSMDSFLRKVTFQEISKQGLRNIGPAVETLAEAEGLEFFLMRMKIHSRPD